ATTLAPRCSFSRTASSRALASYPFITGGMPAAGRTRVAVASMVKRLAGVFGSGTCFTVTTIFIGLSRPARLYCSRRRAGGRVVVEVSGGERRHAAGGPPRRHDAGDLGVGACRSCHRPPRGDLSTSPASSTHSARADVVGGV